jgi:hypothetical protein
MNSKHHDAGLLAEAYNSINKPKVVSEIAPAIPIIARVAPMVIGAAMSDEEEDHMHADHESECQCSSCMGEHDQSEIDMAGRDLLKAREYAEKLSMMVQELPGLEGWVASKITKASDYLSSVFHYLDYEINEKGHNHDEHHDRDEKQIAIMIKPKPDNFNTGYEEV